MVRFRLLATLTACLGLLVCPCAAQPAQGVTLLDFSLPTCRPCRQMDPVVAQLESEGFAIRRVDGSQHPQVAQRFRVSRYPTFIVMAGGREVRRVEGIVPLPSLRQMMVSAVPKPMQEPQGSLPLTFASADSRRTEPVLPPIDVPGMPRTPVTRAEPSAARPTADSALESQLLSCSVRLKVEDATGHSYGTGTIVDTRQGEALVLTCAHLFRDSDGSVIKTPRSVTAEIYEADAGRPLVVERTAVDRILSCNFDSDIAFVSIRLQSAVRPARIASQHQSRQGDAIMTVGCDQGADPSIRSGSIRAINRYTGSPNVTASGAPVVGRSGGGLFNAQGQVVGVCNAADYQEDEGIYAALPAIQAELDKLNLSSIYRGPSTLADSSRAPRQPTTGSMVPLADVVRGQDAGSTPEATGLSSSERAALLELAQRAQASEVVCIVRPKSPDGHSQVLTLKEVSPEFVRALSALAQEAPAQ